MASLAKLQRDLRQRSGECAAKVYNCTVANCSVCGITVPYFADSCQKCGPQVQSSDSINFEKSSESQPSLVSRFFRLSDLENKNLKANNLGSSIDEKDSPSTVPSNSGKIKWVILAGLALAIVAFVLNSNSRGGLETEEDGENGYWVSKCRNVTELNPDYYDSDPSSITDNLSGPSRFITRRQCTDVWVEN